jgi:CHASE2 domain-containing sensor protein
MKWAGIGPKRQFWRGIRRLGVGTVGFLLAFFLVHLPHGPEHWSADLRTALLSDRLSGQQPRIAIVQVDEPTLSASKYLAPVDRSVLAAILRKLVEADVKGIGLDFVFDRRTEDDKDKELLQVIKDAPVPIVLGVLDERSRLSPEGEAFQSAFLAAANRPTGHLYYGEHRNPAVISDQVIREMADPHEYPERQSLAEVLARVGGTYRAPASRLISWLRPPQDGRETFLTLSGNDVIGRGLSEPLPLKEILGGKIVVVGGNFVDRDQHLTPFSVLNGDWYPGLFVHAQILAQLSDPERRRIFTPGWPGWLTLVALAAVGGFMAGVSPRLSARRPWVEVVAVLGFIVTSIATFWFGGFVFPFVAVMLGWGWGEMVGHLRQQAGAHAGGSHAS